MTRNRIDNIVIENARIIFRNFSGEPDKYNKQGGKRVFSVILEEDQAERLSADGWNIKPLRSKDPDDPPRFHLPVEASFKLYPPRIFLIAGRKKTELTEETISSLDYAEIQNVDLTIRPYVWEVNDKHGVKAYVKNMYVTIVEDEFEKKYRDFGDDEEEDTPF